METQIVEPLLAVVGDVPAGAVKIALWSQELGPQQVGGRYADLTVARAAATNAANRRRRLAIPVAAGYAVANESGELRVYRACRPEDGRFVACDSPPLETACLSALGLIELRPHPRQRLSQLAV